MGLHYYKYSLKKGVEKVKTKTAVVLAAIGLAVGSGGGLSLALLGGASAAPPPMATGDVGYTAYGLQRNAQFDAHQGAAPYSVQTGWSMVGSYQYTLTYGGGTYVHSITIATQNGNDFSGTGSNTSATETVNGSFTGPNTFTFTSSYDGSSYAYTVNGTINPDGSITVTSWQSNTGQSGGSWDITGTATAQTASGFNGKGTFNYSDANGNWYSVNVTYVQVNEAQHKTWFAGPVTDGNIGAGQWLFAEVSDGGTPGSNGDAIWGSFTTQQAAQAGVATMADPADGSFAVTSGNLVVH